MRILPVDSHAHIPAPGQTLATQSQRQELLMRAQLNTTGLNPHSELHVELNKRQNKLRTKGTAVERGESTYFTVSKSPLVVAVHVSTMFQYTPQHHARFFDRHTEPKDQIKPPPFPEKTTIRAFLKKP